MNRWYTVELAWDKKRRDCRVLLNGRQVAVLPLLREGAGVSYLRLRATAEMAGDGGVLIESVATDVSESWNRSARTSR